MRSNQIKTTTLLTDNLDTFPYFCEFKTDRLITLICDGVSREAVKMSDLNLGVFSVPSVDGGHLSEVVIGFFFEAWCSFTSYSCFYLISCLCSSILAIF